ncbi:hypothetical protein SDC9_82699 [bioreactor metagenome]|uniref:Uncharacterized protein n=1 Tax=bioreactor metagenome TaxID=1076179 RepID=A0A644ZDY8_9ZZZZ
MKKVKKETKIDNKSFFKMLSDWEEKLNVYFGQKAPKLPQSVIDFIVKVGPYLMIVGLIFSIPALLFAFGLGALISPIAFLNVRYGVHFSLTTIFSLITLVLNIMAIQGLFKRLKSAWNLMFYASLIQAVSYLLSFNLGSLIIGMAISWYFLFQIRKEYK